MHDSRPQPLASKQWVAYFRGNAERDRPIPWERGAETTFADMRPIARSLQAWQLGETSDGRHLRAAAARYADVVDDPECLAAVELFIREEQRHGELLGRFLDLSGWGRIEADWGDRLFRMARYCLRDFEVWTTPVVMVETLAVVYYNAIRRSTPSTVLQEVCRQILSDELPHLRFQCERLAAIFRDRGPVGLRVTMALHRVFFLIVMGLVWVGHRRAFRAGGYSWRRYWRASWDRMAWGWRKMDPTCYDWGAVAEPAAAAAPLSP